MGVLETNAEARGTLQVRLAGAPSPETRYGCEGFTGTTVGRTQYALLRQAVERHETKRYIPDATSFSAPPRESSRFNFRSQRVLPASASGAFRVTESERLAASSYRYPQQTLAPRAAASRRPCRYSARKRPLPRTWLRTTGYCHEVGVARAVDAHGEAGGFGAFAKHRTAAGDVHHRCRA